MLAPQRFFSLPERSEDFLTHAAFLDRARIERDQGRQDSSRIALGAYLVFRLIDRLPLLDGSAEDRESLQWQSHTTRRFLEDLPTGETETAHLLGLLQAIAEPSSSRLPGLRTGLTAYAYYLEHAGRYAEALEVLAEAGKTYEKAIPASEAPSFALFVGRLNRLLARWQEATDAYTTAEVAARVVGDPRSALLSRLGRAKVLIGQGNLSEARAAIERIIAESVAPDLSDVRGRAYHDLGAVLGHMGLPIESLMATYQAFEQTSDPVQRALVLGDLGCLLRTLGAYSAARHAFEISMANPVGFQVRANAYIELMDLESAIGNRVAFERRRLDAQECADRMPPSMAVDYRYRLGVGLARFAQISRARQHVKEALALAETHGLNEWLFRIERVLANLEACRDGEYAGEQAPTAEVWETPAIAEVAAGLERHADRSRV